MTIEPTLAEQLVRGWAGGNQQMSSFFGDPHRVSIKPVARKFKHGRQHQFSYVVNETSTLHGRLWRSSGAAMANDGWSENQGPESPAASL